MDGAFGLWAAASPAHRHLVEGVGAADSWATDAHKWLNVPYDSGIVTVRDAAHLTATLGTQAAYLPGDGREAMHLTPQSSQRARAVTAWAALRHLGRDGIAELVARCCNHASRFAAAMEAAGHEVMNDVVINQVVVHFGTDATTSEVISALQEDGTIWVGPTVWQGKVAMRFSVSSWATIDADIESAVAAVAAVARATAGS
ncbi:MAG: glutamate/tyrosine decarboxylase-like PLP-dependent enzyme [Candidatus Poriferisodalaceae bacterium]